VIENNTGNSLEELEGLLAKVEEQARREAINNQLVLSLQQFNDPGRALQLVVDSIGEALNLDRCLAVLFASEPNNKGAEFVSEYCAEGVASLIKDKDLRERSPIPAWIKEHKCPLVASDIKAHPVAIGFEDIINRIDVRSIAVVPIMYKSSIIGLLSGHQTRTHRNWTNADIDLLNSVATYCASTLENLRLIAKLREANKLKDEFLSTLSHEMRTPLTAINGWLELLNENPLRDADGDFKEGLDTITKASESLTIMINDLLDLSRIHQHSLTLDYSLADANVIVKQAVTSLMRAVQMRNVDLRLELSESLPLIQVDQRRIQKVIWHLLSNAIKFTEENSIITIRTYLDKVKTEDDSNVDWIVIQIEDNGGGINPDFLPFIWEPFRQADASSTRRYGGLGTGLALVKKLVEAHRGQVEVVNSTNGACFTVRLPTVPTI
jgi:signal transduction histidine kinase